MALDKLIGLSVIFSYLIYKKKKKKKKKNGHTGLRKLCRPKSYTTDQGLRGSEKGIHVSSAE